MPSATIRAVEFSQVSMRGRSNGFMVSLTATADLSTALAKDMGWENLLMDGDDFRESWESINLVTSIGKGSLTLKPNGKTTKEDSSHWITLEFDSMQNFHAVYTEPESEKKKPKHQLNFKVKFPGSKAEAILGAYWRKNQGISSQMLISYAEQEEVKTEPAAEAEGGIV